MESFLTANLIVAIIISSIGVLRGLNPKKCSSWLLGLYGFISGVSIGFVGADWLSALQAGASFAFSIIVAGVMIHYKLESLNEEYKFEIKQRKQKDRDEKREK